VGVASCTYRLTSPLLALPLSPPLSCDVCSLIVNAAYAVDSVIVESDQGRAMREIKKIDVNFDQHAFLDELQSLMIPTVAKAFFRLDMGEFRGRYALFAGNGL
jgi:hypothetical protein